MGLGRSVSKYLGVRQGSRGWSDSQVVTSLILLNLAGVTRCEDINLLEADEGLCRAVRRVEMVEM